MTPVSWRSRALLDLAKIATALRAIDPALALAAVDTLITAADRLADFPAIGAPLPNSRLRKLSERHFGYIILYRIGAADVEVVRGRHARENWAPPR